ncbi:MAG: phage holin family protein [Bacteroidota bacterium]
MIEQQEQNNQTDFLEEVGRFNAYAQSYLKDQVEYAKIRIAEESIKTVSGVVHAIILSLLALLLVVFLSVVGGLYLGKILENYVLGFLIVSVFYLLLIVSYLIFKRRLVANPIAKILISKILSDSSKESG